MTSSLWHEVFLEEVADDVTVGHVGTMADQYVDHGIPFLRSLNVEPHRINPGDLKFISSKFHAQLRKSTLRPGDVVIVRTGKPGSCAVIPDWLPDSNCSDLVIVRCGPSLRPRYLSYFVNSAASHHIDSHLVGAVHQHFNVGSARKIRLPLPCVTEQDRICSVLGALDDKIELNRRMNETLETTARAIFKDWFVDFGPTRAKSEGHAPYLAPDIWPLFPDRLDENDKPATWQDKPLSKFFSIIGGGTPKTSVVDYWSGDIPWFSVVDTPSPGSVFVIETEKSITEKGLLESSARLVPEGTTIISARGTVGNLAMTGRPMAFNQSCYGLRGLGDVGDGFVFLAAQNMVGRLQSMAHGSVFSTITRDTFEAVTLAAPSQKLLTAFEKTVHAFFQRIKANVFESHALTQTRDLLLPKLMSGEIRIRDAGKTAEAAA